MKKIVPVPPLATTSILQAINASSLPKPKRDALMKKIDARADYVWREIARMAKIDLLWWDYSWEQFSVHAGEVGIECNYEFLAKRTPLQTAIGWVLQDCKLPVDYLTMRDKEWKALLIATASRWAKEQAKNPKRQKNKTAPKKSKSALAKQA